MIKPVIAIDIDDVLADNAAGFVDFSNRKWGTNLQPSDYTEHWAEVWKVDQEEAARRREALHQSGEYMLYRHDESALRVLRRLSADYNLIIVTSRRLDMRDGTLDWIHSHYPNIFTDEVIHFAGMWDDTSVDVHARLAMTKGDLYSQLSVDYVIDDQLKHCQAASDLGKTALLFGHYKWNQTDSLPEYVTRVQGWSGVEGYFYGNETK